MAKRVRRVLPWMLAGVERRLCTTVATPAAEEVETKAWKPLYRRLSALGKAPKGSVVETLNGWLREGRAITINELMKDVRELRRYKRFDHALELMDWMEKRSMTFNEGTHAIRIDLISKVKGVDAAESYFNSLPEVVQNQLTYGALLSIYCQVKMEDKAMSIYEKMKELNLTSKTLVHNNLLALYSKLGQPEKVISLFQEMKSMNISPDNYTYSILINNYASLNDLNTVEKLMHELEEGHKDVLDWTIFSNLASLYLSAGFPDKTELALKKLEEIRNKRDRMPCHHLISLYASIGNLAEVNRVWKLLKSSFEKTTNMSYLVMFQALSKLDDVDALNQCFQEWESARLSYDIRLVNVVIGTYLGKGMIKEAECLWEQAKQKGAGSDFRTFDYFIDYYLKHDISSALKCLETATDLVKHDEWKPKQETVTAFLKHTEETKDVDSAQAVYKCLKKLNCLDSGAYEYLLQKT
ncbi:HCP-like protein [Dioscorea alata]|uniref:HCP-like protein n=1 Tax=Dioscorea alata TaxID=55571 RepID=A0ACB7VPW2_DIOAL|nr:HCP-like protein [Dioscorea alata]